jgi:hypothetical protein
MRDSEIDRSKSSACPRCLTGDARVVARSPRPGVWTLHGLLLYLAKHRAGLCDQCRGTVAQIPN